MEIALKLLNLLILVTICRGRYDCMYIVRLTIPEIAIGIIRKRPSNLVRVERMVGGVAVPQDIPSYSASFQNDAGNHVCGGAIISERAVLSAAHCFMGTSPQYVTVVVGTTNLAVGGRRYSVIAFDLHTDYNVTSRENDIAIVWTAAEIQFDGNVKRIRLPSITMDVSGDEALFLTGFGAVEPNGESSSMMQALKLNVLDQETCRYAMRLTREVHDSMFCTFNAIGEGTCHGDSGGPLVQGDALVGVVSWGIPCALGFPDVHTRVGSFLPWIWGKLSSSSYLDSVN